MDDDAAPLVKHLPIGRILFGIVTVVALGGIGRQIGPYVPQFEEWVAGLGVWGPVVFMAGYVVGTIALVPGSALTLVGGAVFGLGPGVVYVFTAATVGASLAFLVSRYVAREVIEQRLEGNPRLATVDEAVGREGRKIILLLRLSPIFPFNLLNYTLGLTNVRFVDYVVASIGMLPGSFLYTYYGTVAGDVARLAGGSVPDRGPGYYTVLALGLVATIVVTTLVTRTARRALQEATGA